MWFGARARTLVAQRSARSAEHRSHQNCDQIAQVTDDSPVRSGPATTGRAAIYAYLAAVWSLLYGGMALAWAVGVAGATVVSVLLLTAGLSGWRQGVAEPVNEWAAVSPGLLPV